MLADGPAKQCTMCGVEKPLDQFGIDKRFTGRAKHRSQCRKCRGAIETKRHQTPDGKHRYYETHKKFRESLKIQVVDVYSKGTMRCACCGDSHIEFLAIDHVKSNGNEHRRSIGNKGGYSFYLWLKRNYWPDGFQVLCHNCNQAKAAYGECPHRREIINISMLIEEHLIDEQ